MSLLLILATSSAAAEPWDILFSDGQQGGVWDPADLETMFQDALGTIPVTAVGQPVGLILDKTANGNHLTASGSSRPVLRNDGAHNYLEFDGVDDTMRTVDVIDLSTYSYATEIYGIKADSSSCMWGAVAASPRTNNGEYFVGGRTLFGGTTFMNLFRGGTTRGGAGSGSTDSLVYGVKFEFANDYIRAYANRSTSGVALSGGVTPGPMASGKFIYLGAFPGFTPTLAGRVYRRVLSISVSDVANPDIYTVSDWVNDNTGAY